MRPGTCGGLCWPEAAARRYTPTMPITNKPARKAQSPAPVKKRNRRNTGSVTLADVAKLAGVSAITISRALNTPERVSPETLKQVKEAVERTGYVPNLLAGGLASSKSRLVAALVPTI